MVAAKSIFIVDVEETLMAESHHLDKKSSLHIPPCQIWPDGHFAGLLEVNNHPYITLWVG